MFGSVFALKKHWFNIFFLSDDFDILISKTNIKKNYFDVFSSKNIFEKQTILERHLTNNEWIFANLIINYKNTI